MNNAVVIFLDSINKVNSVAECGVVSTTTLETVFPLASPAKQLILSNLSPFISYEVLEMELQFQIFHDGEYGCISIN